MDATVQILVSVISTIIGLGLICIAGYLLKSVIDCKKEYIIFKTQTEERLKTIQITCGDRLQWMIRLQSALVKMNMNIVRIATKMGIKENELDDITEFLSEK